MKQDFAKAIEELRAGNAELELSRAKADALFNGIGDGAIVTDERGHVSRINPAAEAMLGYTADEIVGKWYPKAVPAFDEKGEPMNVIERPITKAFLLGKPVSGQVFFKNKAGQLFPVMVVSSPVLLGRKPIGAIQIFKDITREYEIDKMKSEFISIASHQLRTPLTAIMTNAHLLGDGYVGKLTEEQQLFMDNITFSVDRMHELISTLLNVTRIEAGKVAVNPKETDLEQMLNGITKEQEPGMKAKKQSLHKSYSLSEPVVTDPILLKEVFANLISNAVKYTPENGKIHIKLAEEGDSIVFSVKDTGYGIPSDQHDKIFTKFFRASNIVKQESVGTGLGLYMVMGIVENLGGKIWFKSQEGKGTTFFVTFPRHGLRGKKGTTTLESTNVT